MNQKTLSVDRARRWARASDRTATVVLWTLACAVPLTMVLVGGYVIVHGWQSVDVRFLVSPSSNVEAGGGIAPQIFDTFYLLVLSMALTVPISIGAALYVAEYSASHRLRSLVDLASETLSSLPSIVAGLFGLLVFVTSTGGGYTVFAGAMTLFVVNLPLAFRVSEEAIRSVPQDLREASLSLGATKWQTTVRVVVPAALPRMITGLIATAGRALGEAAALIYTAGMSAPPLDWRDLNPLHFRSPLSPFRPAETLAVHIWRVNSESLLPDARRVADGSALVLLAIVLAVNLFAKWAGRRLRAKAGYSR